MLKPGLLFLEEAQVARSEATHSGWQGAAPTLSHRPMHRTAWAPPGQVAHISSKQELRRDTVLWEREVHKRPQLDSEGLVLVELSILHVPGIAPE